MIDFDIIVIIAPALVAGILIAITHAPLGLEVLKRGIIFIDLAVAQIAGLGLVASNLYLHEPNKAIVQIITIFSALVAGVFFRFIEKYFAKHQEAIIGVSFIFAASLSILLLAGHPQGGEEIQHLLSGQMLFITWADVFTQAPFYILILLCWFLFPKLRTNIGFYILFALTISSSVQLVGVYVVFSSLILPALAAILSKNKYITSWLCGLLAVITGILFAIISDLPAGPVIVVFYVIWAVLIAGFLKYRQNGNISKIEK